MHPTSNHTPTHDDARRHWLAALLLRQPAGLAARLATGLARLRALPRGRRRRLQQRAAVTLAGAALILGMAGSALLAPPPVHAATITVDQINCTLANAILSANTNAGVGGCAAGSPGLDTIELQIDATLSSSAGSFYFAQSALPMITEDLIIEGNGNVIERTPNAIVMRVMTVNEANVTLRNTTIMGGNDGPGGGIYVRNGGLTLENSNIVDNIISTQGAGLFLLESDLVMTGSTLSGNEAGDEGGALFFSNSVNGKATISNSTFTDNQAEVGGAVYIASGTVDILDSVISGNDASEDGGGIHQPSGTLTVERTTLDDNTAPAYGGSISTSGDLNLSYSTVSNSNAYAGGGLFVGRSGQATISNSTFSGNHAENRGGAISFAGGKDFGQPAHVITHSTITDNTTDGDGGGIFQFGSIYNPDIELDYSIVSGNSAVGDGDEIRGDTYFINSSRNVLSDGGKTTAEAFYNFTPDPSDLNASSDQSGGIALGNILNTTPAANGGPTNTHALVSGSPAIDFATASGTPLDQRGYGRPAGAARDAGAFELGASPPVVPAIYMSTKTNGTVDGTQFNNSDILLWDGNGWTKILDGIDAHLDPVNKPKHNISAMWIDDDDDSIIMAFVQNARKVGNLPAKVEGMDLVRWDGSAWSLWFDGSDVGLTQKTPEKIDALHVLPGDTRADIFGSGTCAHYLLISTQGKGEVTGFPGGSLKFRGEDILGFCMTNQGDATAGFWHMVLDGSEAGLRPNSLDSLSANEDGTIIYFTTSKTLSLTKNGNNAVGGHSSIYTWDTNTGLFSGPHFIAADEGLKPKVNALDVKGPLP